jgi:hypothetical protein
MDNDLERQIRELIDQGARPISLEEVTQRSAPSARRAPGRRRTLISVAAAGVATVGCAAGPAVAFASPGAPPPPVAQASPSAAPSRPVARASASGKASAFLAAATIRRVAAASSAALETSGWEQISYRSVKNGTVTCTGTDSVTYAGSD